MNAKFGGFGFAHLDAHCHLQHDPYFVAYAQAHPEQHFFCMSETPREYKAFAACGFPENVTIGLGLHPWQLSNTNKNNQAMLAEFLDVLSGAWLVGEVGLDFSSKYAHTKEQQLYAFRVIAESVATAPLPLFVPASSIASPVVPMLDPKPVVAAPAAAVPAFGAPAPPKKRVLSIHAVKAAGHALDVLQETGCLNSCTCVFHWFSGTGEELVRARKAGCSFSFSPRALATKRARAYAAQIPPDRLLFESDAFSLDDYP